jgi:outer membrane receptor protein involved in Fe transport
MSLFVAAAAMNLVLLAAITAHAQSTSPPTYRFDLPDEPLGDALRGFGKASHQQIIFSEENVRGKRSEALVGTFTVEDGLQRLLGGSGLKFRRTSAGVIYIEYVEANGPPPPTAENAAALSEVVVTGSRIAQASDAIPAAPTTLIGGAELDERGFLQAGQMLNLVTSNAPEVPVSQAEGYPAGSGQTYPDLFGIGDSRTLTLIDGRRMVTSASGLGARTIDVNVIPTGLIDRIEIDQAGGAAVYGSDAIAGVVNYVLKQNFSGLEVDATDGISSRSDYHTPGFRATFGQNFIDGRANIAADFEYSKTPPLLETQRPPFEYGDEAIANAAGAVPPEVYAQNVRSWNWNTNGVVFTNANSYYYGLPFLPSPAGLLQIKGSPVQFSPNGTSNHSLQYRCDPTPDGFGDRRGGVPGYGAVDAARGRAALYRSPARSLRSHRSRNDLQSILVGPRGGKRSFGHGGLLEFRGRYRPLRADALLQEQPLFERFRGRSALGGEPGVRSRAGAVLVEVLQLASGRPQ